MIGLMVGLVLGPVQWVRSPGSNDQSRTPTSTYQDSRNLIAVFGLVGGLTCGLVVGLAAGQAAGLTGLWPLVGLVLGPALGLALGLVVEPAWFSFVVTSRWLALRGELPWRMMEFLDDAHRLGLVRTAGAIYQFRHAELQDHLAKSGATAAPVQPNDG
jgi:hypothetical protein